MFSRGQPPIFYDMCAAFPPDSPEFASWALRLAPPPAVGGTTLTFLGWPYLHAVHVQRTRLAELGPAHHAHPPYGTRDLRLAELSPLERRREVGGVLRSHVAHAAACTAKGTA